MYRDCGYPYEPFIQDSVSKYLAEKGYSKNIISKGLHEHGVDIRVCNENYGRYWLVECKGGARNAKNASSADVSNFLVGLAQIITRIHSKTIPTAIKGSNKYGVAYPDYFKDKHLKKVHWTVCKQLNLYFFFVDKKGNVEEYDWRKMKKEFPDE